MWQNCGRNRMSCPPSTSLLPQSVANQHWVRRSGTRRVFPHLKHSTPYSTILSSSIVHGQLDYIIIILDYIILYYIILYIIYIVYYIVIKVSKVFNTCTWYKERLLCFKDIECIVLAH